MTLFSGATPAVTPVFVGGAPRTGTTVLHALICTGPRVNDYIAECTYLAGLMACYDDCLGLFDVHTKYYFDDLSAFAEFHAGMVETFLVKAWERTGKPELLALKSPILTLYFHHLARLLPGAKFVVSVREPRDAILSRVEVAQRKGDVAPDDALHAACLEYAAIYRAVLDNIDAFGDRILFVDYAGLVRDEGELTRISGFVDTVHPAAIWSGGLTHPGDHTDTEWATPLYGERMSPASVGRFEGKLSGPMLQTISDLCGDVEERLRTLQTLRAMQRAA